MYKVIINRTINKIGLMRAIRLLNPSFSLKEAYDAAYMLPYTFETLHDRQYINELFSGVSIFSCEELVVEEEKESDEHIKKYEIARKWYDNLSQEERDMVDLLICASSPKD